MLPNNSDYHPHLSNNYYLDGKHQYNRQCVPTQQDGSSTGRHSVLDVKLFTHPGPYVALEESCRLVDLSIGAVRARGKCRITVVRQRHITSRRQRRCIAPHRAEPSGAENGRTNDGIRFAAREVKCFPKHAATARTRKRSRDTAKSR
jgi:hypothetical protein